MAVSLTKGKKSPQLSPLDSYYARHCCNCTLQANDCMPGSTMEANCVQARTCELLLEILWKLGGP